jgi:histidine phosphotransferase ChpT
MSARPDYSALIGSRICHDLVNPIGAIGNGVELMMMDGAAKGPELTLIAESVANATARIRFFRVAFGASGDARLARTEVQSILADLSKGSRLKLGWGSAADLHRREVRLAFLAILCLETVMPYGGTIDVAQLPEGWRLNARARRFRTEGTLWPSLTAGEIPTGITPAEVQFALLHEGLIDLKRKLAVSGGEEEMLVRF